MKRVCSTVIACLMLASLLGGCAWRPDSALPDLKLVTPLPADDWRHNVIPRTEPALFMAWEYRPLVFEGRDGLDVICPMWMDLVMEEDGPALKDLSEMGYTSFDPVSFVSDAHAAGTQVWATVVGFVPEATAAVVRDPENVARIAEEIGRRAKAWGLDGIDLDFENMDPDDTDRFTDFARAVREAVGDRILSVCVTVPMATPSRSPYQAYDRAALAHVCDYVNVMTYDGHKEGVIAPVAGEDWVRYRLELLLRDVPSPRILLGIPMHGVDFWRDEGTEETYTGRITVTSAEVKALLETGTLSAANRVFEVDEWLARGVRQEPSGILMYSFRDIEGSVHRIFLEDEVSLRNKFALVREYSLGGTAIWQKKAGEPEWWTAMAHAAEENRAAVGLQ